MYSCIDCTGLQNFYIDFKNLNSLSFTPNIYNTHQTTSLRTGQVLF